METFDFQRLQSQFSEVQELIKQSNNSVLINQSEEMLENIQEQLRIFSPQFQYQTLYVKQLLSKTVNEIHSFAQVKGNLDQTSFISNLIVNKRKGQQDFQRKIFQFGSMLTNLMKPKDITMSVMIGNSVIEVEDVVFVDLEMTVFWKSNQETQQQIIQTSLLFKELEQKNLQMYVSMLTVKYLTTKIKELKDIIKIPDDQTLFQFDLRPKQKQIGVFSQFQYLIGSELDHIALSKNMEINIKNYQMKINYYRILESIGQNKSLLEAENQVQDEKFQTRLKNSKNFIHITEKFLMNDAPHNNVEIHLDDDKVSLSHLHIPRGYDLELCLSDKFYINSVGDNSYFGSPTLSFNEQLISRSNLLRFGLKLQDDIVVSFKVHLQSIWEGNGQL